jgi:glycosyltransferase involved in cell wall biosynthesis
MIKVSIITVCHNSQATIKDTIESVLAQTYENLEYIIIDGHSSDNSLNIINSYNGRITKVLSEPDWGMYDAMNKGLALATGEIVGFIHSDDYFAYPNAIADIAELFSNSTIEAAYADLDYVSTHDKHKIVRKWRSGTHNRKNYYKGWMPPHPTFYARKSVYDKFGGYNTQMGSAADYELMLRVGFKHKINMAYLPKVLVKMRLGGQSNRTLKNRIKANLEDRKAWSINGLKPKWYTLLLKPASKIVQYLG